MVKLSSGFKKISVNDFCLYENYNLFWKKLDKAEFTCIDVLNEFSKFNNLDLLKDKNYDNFVVGCLDLNDNINGGRIKYLPNGKKLARGGYSIFAKHLTINNNLNNNFDWDVCYENTSGTKTYLYSEDKLHLEQEKKYELVKKFEENYNLILKNLKNDILNNYSLEYLALYFLIKTKIRVGNYFHFKQLGHMGLTTLFKENIKIIKGKFKSKIIFDFIGKLAIPQHIECEVDNLYADLLEKRLSSIKKKDFVFAVNNYPIHSSVFSDILFNYTKIHFYPHIIRSFYADSSIEKYYDTCFSTKLNKGLKITKEDVNLELLKIAANLGHKKFNKKTNRFENNFKITVQSYIYPKLLKKIYSLVEN